MRYENDLNYPWWAISQLSGKWTSVKKKIFFKVVLHELSLFCAFICISILIIVLYFFLYY